MAEKSLAGSCCRLLNSAGAAVSAELSNPHMAVADAAGNIYIADKESHAILKVTPTGTIHTAAGTHVAGYSTDGPALATALYEPNGVFALADGTFYIIDLSAGRTRDRIRRVGTDGQMTTIVPDTHLLGGRALWVSPDEQLLYFAGRDPANASFPGLLRRWTPAGGVEIVASGFVSMGNITVDRNGAPIVTEDSGNRVYRIDNGGVKTLIAGNGATSGGGDGFAGIATGLNRVRGVACLPNGGIFIATQKGAHIWYLDSVGIIHKMVDCAASGSVNAGNGEPFGTAGVKMSEPRAITLAPNGDLIITASDFGQVRVIKSIAPPAPPARLGIEPAPSNMRQLRWKGVPWQSYIVEHAPGLTPGSWQVIGVKTSEPGAETLHGLPETGSAIQGFYRVSAPR